MAKSSKKKPDPGIGEPSEIPWVDFLSFWHEEIGLHVRTTVAELLGIITSTNLTRAIVGPADSERGRQIALGQELNKRLGEPIGGYVIKKRPVHNAEYFLQKEGTDG